MPVRIVVCAGHPVVREGLRTILDAAPELAVQQEVDTSSHLVAAVRRVRPDVVVANLPDSTAPTVAHWADALGQSSDVPTPKIVAICDASADAADGLLLSLTQDHVCTLVKIPYDQMDPTQRAATDAVAYLATRLRDRRLFSRAFAFAANMPGDDYHLDPAQKAGLQRLICDSRRDARAATADCYSPVPTTPRQPR